MASKKLADICSKRGFPKAVVDAMKKVPAVGINEINGDTELVSDDLTIVVSSSAPSNGDGRPNGTVYIQRG